MMKGNKWVVSTAIYSQSQDGKFTTPVELSWKEEDRYGGFLTEWGKLLPQRSRSVIKIPIWKY